MQSKAILEDLISAYQNERNTRTLLPYACVPVEHFLNLVSQRTKFVDLMEASIIKSVYELEAERIKYFVKEYIKERLKKLSINFDVNRSFLSEGELTFYKKYIDMVKKRNIYTERQEESNAREFVGFYCLRNIKSVAIDGDVLEMFRGDFFIASLEDIMEFLKNKEVVLF